MFVINLFFKHGIKHEMSRVKEAMMRQKQIHDHKTIRPVLEQDAAKRMVRGGLYDFRKKNEEFKKRYQNLPISGNKFQHRKINIDQQPINRKRKFSED